MWATWNDTLRDGAPSSDIMAIVVSVFHVKFRAIKSPIWVLTVTRRYFQNQLFFGQTYVCEVGELFRCSYNHKPIEILGSYET